MKRDSAYTSWTITLIVNSRSRSRSRLEVENEVWEAIEGSEHLEPKDISVEANEG